jgi:hypothetical protein
MEPGEESFTFLEELGDSGGGVAEDNGAAVAEVEGGDGVGILVPGADGGDVVPAEGGDHIIAVAEGDGVFVPAEDEAGAGGVAAPEGHRGSVMWDMGDAPRRDSAARRGDQFLCPAGAGIIFDRSTGCARPGFARPSLHPWLRAAAPPGRERIRGSTGCA